MVRVTGKLLSALVVVIATQITGCSSSSDAATPTGVVTSGTKLFVFSSTTLVDGSTGRVNMNNICAAQDSASSFCTAQRLDNANVSTGLSFSTSFNGGWVDTGGILSGGECVGWSTGNASANVLTSTGTSIGAICSDPHSVVCCK